MSAYLVPCLVVFLLLVGAIKKRNPYNSMLLGVTQGINSVVGLFPTIIVIMLSLKCMQTSGLDVWLCKISAPVVGVLGIPNELAYLVVLRPISGSGSIAMLSNIFEQYGADSYIGRCACMIVDGSDTIFYMAGVYFGGLKLKKVWLAVVLALVVSLVGASLGCLLCKIM